MAIIDKQQSKSGNIKKDCIVVNYTGRTGAGTLDALEISKALLSCGECVIPIISSGVENIKMWQEAGFERLIIIETYNNLLSLITNTVLFRLHNSKIIKDNLKYYSVKFVYCPMITFWTTRINKLINQGILVMANHDPIPHSGQSILEPTRLFNPFKKADIVVVHSRVFLDYIREKYKNVAYLPLGRHNMYAFATDKIKIIEYNEEKVNFVFFGRIEKYKGLDVLAEAYKMLSEKYNELVTLTIIGNGDFSTYADLYSNLNAVTVINRWIKDEEVESIFLGNNLINVCPYKDATQSGVVLVAYDYGVPVIATKTGGLPEQVSDGKTGFIVSPNNAKELFLSMEKYVNNRDLIGQQQICIQNYLNNISWETSAKKLIKMVEKFFDKRNDYNN